MPRDPLIPPKGSSTPADEANAGLLPDRYSMGFEAHFPGTLGQIRTASMCLSCFADFMEQAKPEEIELLTEMLVQWGQLVGGMQKGNFFREVAKVVVGGGNPKALWGA